MRASLAAFGGAYDRARGGVETVPRTVAAAAPVATSGVTGPERLLKGWHALTVRVGALPEPVRDMALRGLKKVVDYQDIAYGKEYLDNLDRAVALDGAERGYALSIAAAKHLANAMCYDDMIRVADLKTRSTRGARVRREVGLDGDAILQVTEYFHPRIEEFCGTLPARLGRYIEERPKLAGWLDRRINRGRRIRTDSFAGFAALWFIGGLRRWRRGLLRYKGEVAHLERWYKLALDHVAADDALAVEILELPPARSRATATPCAGTVEVRPRALGARSRQGTRRRRRLDPPPAGSRAEGREGRHARRRAEDRGVSAIAELSIDPKVAHGAMISSR